MSHRVDPRRVRGLVEARLGRPVQDSFEAAVVLEAWGGVAGDSALSLGKGAGGGKNNLGKRAAKLPPEKPALSGSVISEGIALLMAVLAVAAWAEPLSTAYGPSVWDAALKMALPLSFAFQWGFRSRYLSREHWAPVIRADGLVLLLLTAVTVGVLSQFGKAGMLAALLTLTWLGGSVLVRRGWELLYGFGLVGVSFLLHAGVNPDALLSWMVSVVAVLVVQTVRKAETDADIESRPGALADAIGAAVAGGGLGILIVGDNTVGWGVQGAIPALALVPSTIGSFWGGIHLWSIHVAVPRSLDGVSLRRGDSISLRSHATLLLVGSVLRLLAATVALSVVVVLMGPWTSGTVDTSLLVGFACVALGSMGISLLISLGRRIWSVLIVALAASAELALSASGVADIAGAGLILGGTAAAALSLGIALRMFTRPGRTLATAIWIT